MISYIKGVILEVFEREILVSAGDVGYLVMVGGRILMNARVGDVVELFVYPQISRDGDIMLFGVGNKEELNFFKKLISVSGVGPKMAMNILSGSSVEELREAVEKEKVEIFLKHSGIGRKTAQKIILDLKGQIQFGRQRQPDSLTQALSSLGYSKGEIERMVDGVDPTKSLEERIKLALKNK